MPTKIATLFGVVALMVGCDTGNSKTAMPPSAVNKTDHGPQDGDKYRRPQPASTSAAKTPDSEKQREFKRLALKVLKTEPRTQWDGLRQEFETFGRTAVDSVLLPALEDSNAYHRYCAVTMLGFAQAQQAVEPLLAMLKGDDRNGRIYAALALGRIGDSRAVPPLIELLGDKDPAVRWQAEEALGNLKDTRAIQPLIKQILAEKDLGTCYSGAPHLVIIAKKPYEYDPPPAWALAQIGEPAVPDLLAALENEKCSDPMIFALSLGKIGGSAIDPLIRLLESPNPKLAAAAAYGLGEARDKRAVPALLTKLNGSNDTVTRQAAAALGDIGGRRALSGLREALPDKEAALQGWIRDAIREIEQGDSSQSPSSPEPN